MRVEELGYTNDKGLLSLVPLAHLGAEPLLVPHKVHMRTVPKDERVLLVVGITAQRVGACRGDVPTLQCCLRYRDGVSQLGVLLDVVDVLSGGAQEGNTVYVCLVRVGYALEGGVLRCLGRVG